MLVIFHTTLLGIVENQVHVAFSVSVESWYHTSSKVPPDAVSDIQYYMWPSPWKGCVLRKTYICARRLISSEVKLGRILDKHTQTYYRKLTSPMAQKQWRSVAYASLHAPIKMLRRWCQPLALYINSFPDRKQLTRLSRINVLERVARFRL